MRIILHRNFEKRLKKLQRPIQEAYKTRRDLFLENPFHPALNNHSVEKRFPGCRSINVTGDYRVIYEPIEDDVAYFIKIGTHSELYG